MTTLRFLQTGDWHLGQPYRNVGTDLAETLRESRLEAVRRVMNEAKRAGIATVLACGDQFDGPWPEATLVRRMLEILGDYPEITVYMIPGNHDPMMPASVYESRDFRLRPANLKFLDRSEPYPIPDLGATIYPCPCLARYGDEPMGWIPPRDDPETWRIGLAHGSLPACADPSGQNYPISGDAPTRYDLDYVALGDWHTPTPDPTAVDGQRMYYAGAPEVGGWDETSAGWVLDVTLVPGSRPIVRRLRTGRFDWVEIAAELRERADLDRLAARLDRLASPDRLVRVRAGGSLGFDERKHLDRLIAAPDRFADCTLLDRDLKVRISDDDEPPRDPILRGVHERLVRLLADPADGLPASWPTDLAAPDVEAIRLAYLRFRDLLS